MTTFDKIIPIVKNTFENHRKTVGLFEWLLVNRDLNGRVKLIAPEIPDHEAHRCALLTNLANELSALLGPHGHKSIILFEQDRSVACQGGSIFPLEGFPNVSFVDRLATEGNWASIAKESDKAPRIVFFSIKGGVGRSSALAATAWSLAQAAKRVLVLDLDLESPGISTSLLPEEKRPLYGITDWLLEDLVDNSEVILDSMVATSDLSHDGEIYVAPAHGSTPGEYVSKLGRVWMPKVGIDGSQESWSRRLQRLLSVLEQKIKPDVILIDSRAGIDEVASSCVTDLGAHQVLLFSIDGSQTWSGYRILFNHWRQAEVVEKIRDRLQIISALTPELDEVAYFERLRDNAYDLFLDNQYEEIPPGEVAGDRWSFESTDDTAPHYPWTVKWHRSFAGIRSLHHRLMEIDSDGIKSIFGPLIKGVHQTLGMEKKNA